MGVAASQQPVQVLLVGADRVAGTLAARLIERLGHPSPSQAADAQTAAAKIGHCDVLLLDADTVEPATVLPLLAGGSRPRVLAMSAGDFAQTAGVDAWLRKPLQSSALAAALAVAATSDAQQEIWGELLRLFGREGLVEMIATLRGDLAKQQQQIDEALQGQDDVAVRRAAHTLRGVGLQFGATAFVDLCSGVEQSEKPAAQPAQVIAMRDAYGALVRTLEGRLDGR